jgi:phage-related protein
MAERDKPLAWLAGEIKTPPFSPAARLETGALLRRLQGGESLGLPQSRPMPAVGKRCHELRVVDADATWRIVYHIAADAIVILGVFGKKSRTTPKRRLNEARRRLASYYAALEGD